MSGVVHAVPHYVYHSGSLNDAEGHWWASFIHEKAEAGGGGDSDGGSGNYEYKRDVCISPCDEFGVGLVGGVVDGYRIAPHCSPTLLNSSLLERQGDASGTCPFPGLASVAGMGDGPWGSLFS